KQAGAVTKSAHDRIERALAEFNSRGEEASERLVSAASDLGDRAEKATRSTRKKARKQAKQATKAAQAKRKQLGKKKKSKSKSFFSIAGILALIAAVLGGVYYLLRRNDIPGEVPPRVEDFADKYEPDATGSTLVYTSTTADDVKEGDPVAGAIKVGGDLTEGGAEERDERLLKAREGQLAAHRDQAETGTGAKGTEGAESAEASDIDTTRVTDDSEDEGKHRLEGDE